MTDLRPDDIECEVALILLASCGTEARAVVTARQLKAPPSDRAAARFWRRIGLILERYEDAMRRDPVLRHWTGGSAGGSPWR